MAILLALGAQAAAPSTSASGQWTWTLYPDNPVVLAHEVPDTARLRTTLECDPGSGVARLTFHEAAPAPGMARLTSGQATAIGEVVAGRRGASSVTLRTDHPTFAAFAGSGQLNVTVGAGSTAVEVGSAHRPLLQRFREMCGG